MVRTPIWCRCKKHSWTRSEFRRAWENDMILRCSNDACEHEVGPERMQELLTEIGELLLEPKVESDGPEG